MVFFFRGRKGTLCKAAERRIGIRTHSCTPFLCRPVGYGPGSGLLTSLLQSYSNGTVRKMQACPREMRNFIGSGAPGEHGKQILIPKENLAGK